MTTYYTLTAAGNLERLELPVVIDGRQRLHPSPEQAAALGAYPRNDTYYPTDDPPEGKMWQRAAGYTVRDGRWCAKYEAVDIPPPPPRSWTPLSIKRACGSERWPILKSALEALGFYDEFLMAQEIREDDPSFAQGYEWAVAQFGKETVDEILASAAQEA